MGVNKLSTGNGSEIRPEQGRPTRRWVLRTLGVSGLAASAAGISLADALVVEGKKKNKNKKKRCPGGLGRCHGVCMEPGVTCCPGSRDGLDGMCPTSHPNCCPLSMFGGCCPLDYPVCCTEECCATDEICGSDGYCRSS